MDANHAFWWLGIGLLALADATKGRRRLMPLLAFDALTALLNPVNFDLGVAGELTFATIDQVMRMAGQLVWAAVAHRHLRPVRGPQLGALVVLVVAPIGLLSPYEVYMICYSLAVVAVALGTLVGLYESAHRGERLPGGTDVTLALMSVTALVSFSVVLIDHLANLRLAAAVWPQITIITNISFLVGAVAHFVDWKKLVTRLG